MPIKGAVVIQPNPVTRTWDLKVANTGTVPIGVTQNILPPGGDRSHDDHMYAGHGLVANPNRASSVSFKEGDTYGLGGGGALTVIGEGSTLRVGLRGLAYHTLPLPPLDGQPVVVNFDDFTWYGGSPETARMDNVLPHMRSYEKGAKRHLNVDECGADEMLRQVETLLGQPQAARPQGMATVTAVQRPGGAVSHWEVRFKNGGEVPFIGTIAFDGGNKRDGAGLESMAVPNEGSEALQRIEANANYGLPAVAGARLRVGVRGFGYTDPPVELPRQGSVEVPLNSMRRESSQASDEFFDLEQVLAKRAEKGAVKEPKVQFFDNGRAINGELKRVVHHGARALAESDFSPPRVVIQAAGESEETPGGGWTIELTNQLPAEDADGSLGFVATLSLGNEGVDAAVLAPKKFQEPGLTKRWFLPEGAKIGNLVAEPGAQLRLGTRGLGFAAKFPLPGPEQVLDTAQNPEHWAFFPDQVNRENLTHEFTDGCRE